MIRIALPHTIYTVAKMFIQSIFSLEENPFKIELTDVAPDFPKLSLFFSYYRRL